MGLMNLYGYRQAGRWSFDNSSVFLMQMWETGKVGTEGKAREK